MKRLLLFFAAPAFLPPATSADIKIRWTLQRGDTGLHTSCTFDHLPEYPAAAMTEARLAAKVTRHGRQGLWHEREQAFDAALLKPGANVLKIIAPSARITDGILYDYVRLELDEARR